MTTRTGPEDEAWSDYASEIATNLRRLRHEASLSHEDVAYRSGLTRYTHQKYEKGHSKPGTPANPTIRSLLAMPQALGVSLMDILPAKIPDLRLRYLQAPPAAHAVPRRQARCAQAAVLVELV